MRTACVSWESDDITKCGKEFWIDFFFPCIALVISAAFLIRILNKSHKYKLQSRHVVQENNIFFSSRGDFSTINSLHSPSHPNQESELFFEPKTVGDKTRALLEALLGVSQFGIHAIRCLHISSHICNFHSIGAFISCALWLLILIVIFCRITVYNQSMRWLSFNLYDLWIVCIVCYTILFSISIVAFRSVSIGHVDDKAEALYIKSQFFTNLALFFLTFTGRIENSGSTTKNSAPRKSLFGFLTFSWIDGMIWKARRQFLTKFDIWDLDKSECSRNVVRKFTLLKTDDSRLFLDLLKFFRTQILVQILLSLTTSIMNFVPTLFMRKILDYILDNGSQSSNSMWSCAYLMLASRIVSAVCHNQAQFLGERATIRLRSILISEIYQKTLRRKVQGSFIFTRALENHQSATELEIEENERKISVINIMSVDAFKVSEVCSTVHNAMEACFMIMIAFYLLYCQLGWPAIIGSLVLLAFLPVNFKLSEMFGKLQMDAMSLSDKRTSKVNEALQAIKTIKAFFWEEFFMQKIKFVRNGEVSLLRKKALLMTCSHFIWFINPTIVSLITFSLFIYSQGKLLTAPIAFTAFSLFAILKTPMSQIATTFSGIAQSKVFLERIDRYLKEPETTKYESLSLNYNRIGFDGATLAWSQDPNGFKLRNISVDFRLHQMNIVLGPTGSGKSSLLLGLLGELELSSGTIYVPCIGSREGLPMQLDDLTNSISYCPQTPWLLNRTVKENIVFGQGFNKTRYDAVVECCCLDADFQALIKGDQTMVGDRGITLSGGQQQRISLGRAVYSNSMHVLLDDCLSAVDPETALYIYEKCICGELMRGRTCIFATHNATLMVERADWIVVLESGTVVTQGTKSQLNYNGRVPYEKSKKKLESKNTAQSNFTRQMAHGKEPVKDYKTSNYCIIAETDTFADNSDDIAHEENKLDGTVDFSVYSWYTRYLGGWGKISLFTVLTLFIQAIIFGQGFWVRYWLNSSNIAEILIVSPQEGKTLSHDKSNGLHSDCFFLSFYFIIGFVYAIFQSGKMQIAFTVGINAAKRIFFALLSSVFHAKLRFHEITPVGRIINRFNKDMDVIDQQIIQYFEGFFYCLAASFLTLLLICVVTPQFLFFAIPISFLYVLVAHLYMRASRELKRIDSIGVSPVHQSFSETLQGIDSIRAFGDESRFISENLSIIDNSNAPYFYLCLTNEWVAFRIDILGAFIMFSTTALVLSNISSLDSAMAGILLTNALAFTEGAQWLVKLYSSIELSMSSVERVKEYIEVEPETVENSRLTPNSDWPTKGKIVVSNLSLRYSPALPKVLKSISFSVEANTKVGIVGRTGAGKSSLITAFYRFVEAESGTIDIDGVDIAKIPLKSLRRSINSIPQNPTLFDGTIRSNLDPNDEFDDREIFRSMLKVNLIDQREFDMAINRESRSFSDYSTPKNFNVFNNLGNQVGENGSNFSQGQRQLLCLARSLLRARKILLIDEATASIDYDCDAKIQKTIRENLCDTTVLTIAHRLASVIDYDKIMLMDDGEIKEYNEPYLLLVDENSMFHQFCKKSGEWDSLFRLAKESYEARNS